MSSTKQLEQQLEGARDRTRFWEETARRHAKDAKFYQEQLVKAETLIGRLLLQLAERWDVARLTKWRGDREPGGD